MSDVRVKSLAVEITPEDFWRHGYRVGWNDREAGRAHLLDEPPAVTLADVIMLSARKDGRHA